ncbi:MAG: copper chaperone PCu(A)C [Luteimonas sp.]
MDRHPEPRPHRIARKRAALVLALALGALLVAAPAFAADCLPQVEGAWIRMPPAGLPMMAGYARISNPCKGPLAIVGARSAAFADTSLHETRVENGMSRMRATPALRLAPGGSAVLEPGGFHLMLMDPVKPLHAGDRVAIEFTLEDGRRFSVPFEARPIAVP